MFYNVELYFNSLKYNGREWGYYHNTTKIILTCILIIPKHGICLAHIMGFGFARGHVWGILDEEMREKYSCIHKKGREISSGKFLHGFLCNPSLVYIFAPCVEIYGTSICRSVKLYAGNLLDSFYIWKIKTPSFR